jgi:hypothetical protein
MRLQRLVRAQQARTIDQNSAFFGKLSLTIARVGSYLAGELPTNRSVQAVARLQAVLELIEAHRNKGSLPPHVRVVSS